MCTFRRRAPRGAMGFLGVLSGTFPFGVGAVRASGNARFACGFVDSAERGPFSARLEGVKVGRVLVPPEAP